LFGEQSSKLLRVREGFLAGLLEVDHFDIEGL